jgi:cytochrome c biogenesis protein CcmG/thiol:disulfide interchange protein DsbE
VLAVAVVMIGLVVVLLGGSDKSVRRVTTPNVAAPAVRSDTLDDGLFDLSRRKGSWVVLNFFDTRCAPCVAEHPQLVAFEQQQNELGAAGAEVYTVIFGSDEREVRDFFAENGGDWPIIRDPDGAIGVSFGVFQVPETWLIDPDGTIVMRFAGEITAEELAINLQVLRERYARG